VVDGSGNVILGHTSTFATRLGGTTVTPGLQQLGTSAGVSSYISARFSNDTAASATYFAKSRSANRGEHAIVNAGDQLGSISFGGSDGAKIVEAVRISAFVDGAPGTDDMPGRILFSTTSDGGSSVAERLRITSDGVLQIADAGNVSVGTTTGTKIGTSTSQRLGFYNATPIVQPSGANQAALTNSTGGTADGTLSAVSGTGDDADINNNFTELHRLVSEIRTALVNLGLMKGAA
jgi:hypothetical protein